MFFNDIHHENSQIDLYRFLNISNIDYQDPNFNIKDIREKVHDLVEEKRKQIKEEERVKVIINDKKLAN